MNSIRNDADLQKKSSQGLIISNNKTVLVFSFAHCGFGWELEPVQL